MDAIQMIKNRRSVRRYKPEVVSKDVLEKIVEVARFSPSWGNTQVARYNFVQTPELIKEISENCVNGFIYNSKVLKYAKNVLVLTYVQGKSGQFDKAKAESMGLTEGFASDKGSAWEEFDAGIACQTFCLAAHEMGVGTCIMGVIDSKKIAKAISLPKGETVAALITFGYPDEEPKPTPRKDVEKIMRVL